MVRSERSRAGLVGGDIADAWRPSALPRGLWRADAAAGERAITCTNPASGASWQISIDYDKSTVDSNPARISDAEISWHDAKDGGNYTLDRNPAISP